MKKAIVKTKTNFSKINLENRKTKLIIEYNFSKINLENRKTKLIIEYNFSKINLENRKTKLIIEYNSLNYVFFWTTVDPSQLHIKVDCLFKSSFEVNSTGKLYIHLEQA